MGISIAIATHNRASELEQTLASLENVDSGEEDFEVLVIDNRSNDTTAEVVRSFEPRFGRRLRYVYEERLGLSCARNRAVQEARYEIVAFLDDDVDVDSRWLLSLADDYRSGDYAAVGGKAYLIYPTSRPHWLAERNEGLLTKVDLGSVRHLANPDELYGLNLSIKKEWFSRVGLFRIDLGRIGKCLIGGEEEELLARIADAGGHLLYEPDAVVAHRVPRARLRRSWFWSRSYWGNLGEARTVADSLVSPYQLLRSTWHIGLASWELIFVTLKHGPASEDSFNQIRILAGRTGYWVGLLMRLSLYLCFGSRSNRAEELGGSADNAAPEARPMASSS